MLGENYRVVPITNLGDGVPVNDDVDVLVVAGPEAIEEVEARQIEQFLMRGGSVIVLAGRYRLDPEAQGTIGVEPVTSGLDEWLAHHGITVGKQLIADKVSESFPMPVQRTVDGVPVRDIPA